MKTITRHLVKLAMGLALIHVAQALTTGFTYQGKLTAGSGTANGLYDFQFKLFGTPSNPLNPFGSFTTNSVPVSNGLFTVTIDFGSAWDGTDRWLEILVKTNGAGSYATLSPRQTITSTPYAIYTGSAGWAASASQASAVLPGAVTGTGIASNQVVRSINGMTDGVSIPTNFWSLTGNGGTTDANFVGTTDFRMLQFRVDNLVGLRIQPGTSAPNIIGGDTNNFISSSSKNNIIGNGANNAITNNIYYAGILGGYSNRIDKLATDWWPDGSFIGGGYMNTSAGYAAAVPGGYNNYAYGEYSFAAGYSAKAMHRSAFVWSDFTLGGFQSTANNQFLIRATGGVGIGTNNPQGALHVAGTVIASSFIGNVSGLSGTITNSLTFDTGSAPPFNVNSTTVVPSLNADLLDGLNAGSLWQLGGNSGTTTTDYLGTLGLQPLLFVAAGKRALSLEYVSTAIYLVGNKSINTLGGYWGNSISSGVIGATIAGGGYEYFSGLSTYPHENQVTGHYGAVGGGFDNTAGYAATVPGGSGNSATGMGSFAAGRNANATHNGTFVWNDGTSDAYSTGTNRFEVFAENGANLSVGSAAVAVDSLKGISLSAADRPVITRGFDAFTSNASDNKAGLGRWGLFMEPSQLVVGIPSDDKPGRSFAVGKYETNGTYTTLITVNQAGVLTCNTMNILGGADLAEPFAVSGENVPKGAAMIIDDANPGSLKMSCEAYDTRVAGIVSGANGITPGIHLKQSGKLDGGENIALSGRVYALADAGSASIKPGDLLTTSSTPGHIMKAADPARAQGAIIGKAMSALPAGKGYVLVLVNLQ